MQTDCDMYRALEMLCSDAQLCSLPGQYLARRVLRVAQDDNPMKMARAILGAFGADELA